MGYMVNYYRDTISLNAFPPETEKIITNWNVESPIILPQYWLDEIFSDVKGKVLYVEHGPNNRFFVLHWKCRNVLNGIYDIANHYSSNVQDLNQI